MPREDPKKPDDVVRAETLLQIAKLVLGSEKRTVPGTGKIERAPQALFADFYSCEHPNRVVRARISGKSLDILCLDRARLGTLRRGEPIDSAVTEVVVEGARVTDDASVLIDALRPKLPNRKQPARPVWSTNT